MRERVLAIAAAICSAGCAAQPPLSADVYFRPFDATSVARMDEGAMVTAAGTEFHITDAARLAHILSIIDVPCSPSPHPPEDMDLRLLIYFNGNAGRTTWKASRFEYFDGFTNKMCAMTPALLAALSKEFEV